MRNKFIFLTFLGLSNLITVFNSFGQITDVEQITIFSSRLKNPIVLDVKSDTSNIYFNAKNNSLYPYILEIKFGEFRNLSPRVFEKKVIVLPGNNRLFIFRIMDKNEAPALTYQTKYYLASTNTTEEKFNSYLIPIGENKIVDLYALNENGSLKKFVNHFVMKSGDIVFCARKGVVTALPDNQDNVDRIYNSSLEIRHDDGTIAVYLGLNPDNQIVKLGQKVFPSQPIGKVNDSNLLIFHVYEIHDEGKLVPIETSYSGSNNKIVSSFNIDGINVTFPKAIIKKEMNKKEISKYDKNTLF